METKHLRFESCVISARSKAEILDAMQKNGFESCVISAEFKALLYIHSKRSDEND